MMNFVFGKIIIYAFSQYAKKWAGVFVKRISRHFCWISTLLVYYNNPISFIVRLAHVHQRTQAAADVMKPAWWCKFLYVKIIPAYVL